jgi:hypothetical protein
MRQKFGPLARQILPPSIPKAPNNGPEIPLKMCPRLCCPPPSVENSENQSVDPALTIGYLSSTPSDLQHSLESPIEREFPTGEKVKSGKEKKAGSTQRERPKSKAGKTSLLWDNVGFAAAAVVGGAGWVVEPQIVEWMRRNEPGQRAQ